MTIADLFIVGGGINGVGIARDAAGRGLDVVLCEQNDLAMHTSSASTKLIHGGLRYLEHYEFRLVREALIERETLLKAAPHIIWPLRFVLPYDKGLRPAWLLRLGLFLYDNLGGRKMLPATTRVDLNTGAHHGVLQEKLSFGFEYSDCWVEDARLVALNAVDANERGAEILTRTTCTALARVHDTDGSYWRATLSLSDGEVREVKARAVINAAGPWVDDIVNQVHPGRNERNVRLVKGSHIVTHTLYDGDHCYIFQNPDDRIIFAIPYENDYTLIGTTDLSYQGDQGKVEISEEEIDYLCAAASEYFSKPVTRDQIAWTYAGVRPLYEDNASNNSTVTRDYTFDLDGRDGEPPILSIFGGKITTYRKLAEHALDKLGDYTGEKHAPWTKDAALPGGDIPGADFDRFLAEQSTLYPWLPAPHLRRLARAYGTRVETLLDGAASIEGLGTHFGAGLYEAELRYLIAHEFVQSADDILWRRSKLGLHLSSAEQEAVKTWFADKMAA